MKKKLQELKARLDFWWAKKTLKDGRDFELMMNGSNMLVTITSGKFKGVCYEYSPLSVREDDGGLIDFQTYILYNPMDMNGLHPGRGVVVDLTGPEFQKLTSNILRILLADAIPEKLEQYRAAEETEKVLNENRNTDTVEPVAERGFYEESTPLLEKRVSARKPRKKAVRTDASVHSQVQQPAKPKRNRARITRAKRPK